MLDSFWDGVLHGQFQPCSDEYIHTLLRTRVLSEKPLIALSPGEENTLYSEVFTSYKSILNNRWHVNDLCGDPVIFLAPDSTHPLLEDTHWWSMRDDDNPTFLVKGAALDATKRGYIPLQVPDKIQLFTNPEIWEWADSISENSSGGVVGMGSRPFFLGGKQESYGFSHSEFASIVHDVLARVGHADLRFCDIGGNTGLACHDVQRHYPKFHFTNITLDEEKAMWLGIQHIYVPAERMPERFRESFDVMVSNMAWRYFVYPDIAIKNTLQALSIGGYASISFFADQCPLPRKEIEQRVQAAVALLQKLDAKGVIDFQIKENLYIKNMGYMTIVKNKPIRF